MAQAFAWAISFALQMEDREDAVSDKAPPSALPLCRKIRIDVKALGGQPGLFPREPERSPPEHIRSLGRD